MMILQILVQQTAVIGAEFVFVLQGESSTRHKSSTVSEGGCRVDVNELVLPLTILCQGKGGVREALKMFLGKGEPDLNLRDDKRPTHGHVSLLKGRAAGKDAS